MIPQYEPLINYENLHAEISKYLLNGKPYLTEFKKTQELEQKIAEFLGVKHCFMVNNGTISLSLALMALGVKAGDRVACPALSMIASANAIRFIGAVPVFVDVEESFCMSLARLKEVAPHIKALMYVSLNGVFNQDVVKWAVANGIPIVEDNAQSFGSRMIDGNYIGNTYEISSFSFSMPKIITCGQGGCLTTNSDTYAHQIKKLKDFGREGGGLDIHDEFGINSKFTEMQAIALLEQMKDLEWRIARKKEIYETYAIHLGGRIDSEDLIFHGLNTTIVTPWFVTVLAKRRTELMAHLKSKGIGTRPYYGVIPHQECYMKHSQHQDSFVYARLVEEHGLWLPSSLTLTNEQIEQICEKIVGFYA